MQLLFLLLLLLAPYSILSLAGVWIPRFKLPRSVRAQGGPVNFLCLRGNWPLHPDRTNGGNVATMGAVSGRVDLCHRSVGVSRRHCRLGSFANEANRRLPDPDADLRPAGQYLFCN